MKEILNSKKRSKKVAFWLFYCRQHCRQKSEMTTILEKLSLAGDEGFEPPITGPEPVALPLGQSPITG